MQHSPRMGLCLYDRIHSPLSTLASCQATSLPGLVLTALSTECGKGAHLFLSPYTSAHDPAESRRLNCADASLALGCSNSVAPFLTLLWLPWRMGLGLLTPSLGLPAHSIQLPWSAGLSPLAQVTCQSQDPDSSQPFSWYRERDNQKKNQPTGYVSVRGQQPLILSRSW